MKHKSHNLYLLYNPRNWIIITLLLFSEVSVAQEQTSPEEFIVGTSVGPSIVTNPAMFNSFVATGMNTIHQRADNDTKDLLSNYNLVAYNTNTATEYIHHYTTSYYSKWEAEIDVEADRVGFKHRDSLGNLIGNFANWKGKSCWSSLGLFGPRDSLIYGPHYRQEKRYKRWNYGCYNDSGCVTYTPRFRMALNNQGNAGAEENVCKIKVVFRYKDLSDSLHHDVTFIERTLKVGDFDTLGNFDYFYLHQDPALGIYEYYPNFILPKNIGQMVDSEPPINYIDWEEYTGIQFWVDWLRDDTLCTLYIDYAEVYDNDGGDDLFEDSLTAANTYQNILDYAEGFSDWNNIKFWGGADEPYTIDSYIPIHIVDSLIQSVQAPPLVVNFQPTWWHTLNVNGEDEIEMFYNIAKPSKITLSVNPVSADYSVIRYADLEWVRFNLQRTSLLDSNFWFHTQVVGYRKNYPNNPPDWCVWRKPDPPELKAMVSLALAHGAKGIVFLWFDSYWNYSTHCSSDVYLEGIVDENGTPIPNTGNALYNTIKDNLVPRLKGILGTSLMKLDYTGDFLQYRYQIPTDNPEPVESNYLILGYGTQALDGRNWHCGFFDRPGQTDNKYFLLANLYLTADSMTVQVKVTPPVPDYQNYRFRNIEGYFDETFKTDIIKDLTHLKGEGYLYQVAPVIKYGGRLLYSESTQAGMILYDDMIIENGAVLTVNGVYSSKGNITVKNGGIINGSNGKIQFVEGKKLIIEGSG
ncbi:hypothetical protein, partial [Ignavibacterium album]|uniref:hypothetical protein n=1 Tax=Ignavibacterium album TaxID=591197 RepID=UPI0038B357A7